jgi:molybdate transport system substrate-binding protein
MFHNETKGEITHSRWTIPIKEKSMKRTLLVTVFLTLPLFLSNAHAGKVTLSVAASLTNAFNDLITAFNASSPDVQFQPNYASSGSLAKQIEQGAPADIFVSANPKWMAYLLEKELIAEGTDKILVYNTLVFVGTTDQASSLADLPGLARIALGTPESVPAGQYAKQAMENANIYATLEADSKLVMAKDVRQALVYADRGEVDGAFVYKTDALLATQAKILFTVPADLHTEVSYPLGLTVEGAKKAEARAFYDFLGSAEALAIFEKYGFLPATK